MRHSYDTLLFDLDGTLTDSAEGIINSVKYALNGIGIYEYDQNTLNDFIGPTLAYSFATFYKLPTKKTDLAIKLYRERYSSIGKFENRLYDGVEDLLAALKAAGFRIILATGKPLHFSREILEHFNLTRFFDLICGSDEKAGIISKADVINEIKRQTCGIDKEHAVMIGDRKYDAEGALQCGLDCIGVLYGYGTRKELETAGSFLTVNSVSELQELLLNHVYI